MRKAAAQPRWENCVVVEDTLIRPGLCCNNFAVWGAVVVVGRVEGKALCVIKQQILYCAATVLHGHAFS